MNSVSHELRTPLAAISSVASGLRAAGELNAAQQSLTVELDEATRRLNRLVRNLLDLSRLEAGHLRMNADWHDLRDLLRSALQNLGQSLSRHEIKIDVPNDFPPVKLDAILTEQILVNLLGNAAVHTPPGTKVEFSARAEEDQLVLRVADNGPGLPPGDTARWFDRFQRGPDAVAGGTGIGLSLVKGFAEAQGGSVSAENRRGRRRGVHGETAADETAAGPGGKRMNRRQTAGVDRGRRTADSPAVDRHAGGECLSRAGRRERAGRRWCWRRSIGPRW